MNTITLPRSATSTTQRSDLTPRYGFVPTTELINAFERNDWVVTGSSEAKVRKPSNLGFQKHLIRFAHRSQLELNRSDRIETILINSHDGTSSLQLGAGVFRMACANGVIVAESVVSTVRLNHIHLTMDDVLTASHQILASADLVSARVEAWKNTPISYDDAMHLAEQGIQLRWPDLPADARPVTPTTMIQARRMEDTTRDLWTTFNVVQENLIRGGVVDSHRRVNPRSPRQRTFGQVRGLKSLDENVRINRGLWEASEVIFNSKQ